MPGRPSSNGFEGERVAREDVLRIIAEGRAVYCPEAEGPGADEWNTPYMASWWPEDVETALDMFPDADFYALTPERSKEVQDARNADHDRERAEFYARYSLPSPDARAKLIDLSNVKPIAPCEECDHPECKLARIHNRPGAWKHYPEDGLEWLEAANPPDVLNVAGEKYVQADDSDRFKTKNGVVSVRLSAVQGEAVNWYVPGLVPKSLHTVLAAPGGTGKGLFYLWLLAHHIEGNVLYFNSEDDHALMLRPRMEAAGIDPDRLVPIFGNNRERPGVVRWLRFPTDVEVLKRAIDQHGARAVIVDSGIEFMDPDLAANKAEDVRRVTSMFNDVSRTTRVLPLDILHTNKNRDARGVERVGHAKTWTDASRHVLMMAADDVDENVRHVEVVKTNVAKKGEGRQFRVKFRDVEVYDPETDSLVLRSVPYLEDEGPSTKSVEELLSAKASTDDPEAIDRAILAALIEAGGSMPSTALDKATAETQSCSPRTATNHRKGLAKRGLVRSSPGERNDSGTVARWDVIITEAGREEADRMGGPPDDGSGDW